MTSIDFDALWDFQDPVGSERRIREAAETESDAEARAVFLTQLARALGLQGRFDEGHTVLDEAARLLATPSDELSVRVLLERGRLFNSGGDPIRAKGLFLEAFELAVAAGLDALAVDAAHMVAIAETGEASQEWNFRALEIAESSSEPKAQRWKASLYNNIGWNFHEEGRYEEALAAFLTALELRREQEAARAQQIAEWCVARCLRSLGRYEEALRMQERLVEADPEGSYVHEEVGECLLALGRVEEAKRAFARAYDLLSADAAAVEPEAERLERLKRLAT
ncbi:MAG: hypothetical protein KatS3mg015_1213 [Fimbriimonadales bacterium]|nr:MAG: hypothetical protein KatS3mg015_1213 [Fimbriimonadales bacterium]